MEPMTSTHGDNLKDLHKLITDANAVFDRVSDERSENNEDTQAHLKVMENKGISRRAFRMARAYTKMSVEDRQGFDTAYEICRDALGLPVQGGLFDELKPIEPKKPGRKKAEEAPAPEPVAEGAAA
jgi:hypothetical protein